MSLLKLSTAARQDMASTLLARLDGGTGPARAKFYTGTQPAGPGTAVTDQVLLGTLTCSDPCATAASGVLTFAAITEDAAADATGTAAWVRFEDGDGVAVLDVSVSNLAGDGIIKLNTVSIVEGGPLRLNSFSFTVGGA